MVTAADEAAKLFNFPPSTIGKTHPEDTPGPSSRSSDEDSSSLDDKNKSHDDEDDDSDHDKMPAAIDPSTNYRIPRGISFDANTGPKGVIADARAFERAKKQKWRFLSHSKAQDTSSVSPAVEERSVTPEAMVAGDKRDQADTDDRDFFDRWRKSELSKVMSRDVRNRRRSPSVRQYGTMHRVDAVGYLDAIEKVGHDTMVVVCIYDDESDVSHQVEDCLASLARKYTTTRFVKLHFEEAEVDVAGVPTVLAYRGGDLFANLTSLVDEIPEDQLLTPSTIERVLKMHQILD